MSKFIALCVIYMYGLENIWKEPEEKKKSKRYLHIKKEEEEVENELENLPSCLMETERLLTFDLALAACL